MAAAAEDVTAELDALVGRPPGFPTVDQEAELAARWDGGEPVADALDRRLRAAVAAGGAAGWRPHELERVVAKLAGGIDPSAVSAPGGVAGWSRHKRRERRRAVSEVLALIRWIELLPTLPGDGHVEATGVEPAVLAKVRALVAKAESTTFPAEAEALLAKAHELIVRHAIDEVSLKRADTEGVVTRRIFVDDPYARARFHLLDSVARSFGCRALWWSARGYAVVYGFAADLEATELLFTSLLVQATTELAQARPPRGTPVARTASFRRSFLFAYSDRIGKRLQQARRDLGSDAAGSLLPVLVARQAAVDAAVEAASVGVRKARWSITDARGWRAGADAAGRASLDRERPIGDRRRALDAS